MLFYLREYHAQMYFLFQAESGDESSESSSSGISENCNDSMEGKYIIIDLVSFKNKDRIIRIIQPNIFPFLSHNAR